MVRCYRDIYAGAVYIRVRTPCNDLEYIAEAVICKSGGFCFAYKTVHDIKQKRAKLDIKEKRILTHHQNCTNIVRNRNN